MRTINIPKVEFYTRVKKLIESNEFVGFCHACNSVIFIELGYNKYLMHVDKDEKLKRYIWNIVDNLLSSNNTNDMLYDLAKYNPNTNS